MKRCLLALILLFPALAQADYVSDYREGVAAAERQQWDKVDTLMRSAMAQEPNPKPRIRLYGQVYVPYAPRFYLGLSAFSRKDCATAVSLLEDAATSGVARGQRLEERQQIMLRSCRAQLAKAAPSPAQPPSLPATAPTVAVAQTPPRATTPPPQPTSNPATAKPPPVTAPKPAPATPPPASPAAFDSARAQAASARLDRVDAALSAAARTLADPALADVRSEWQRQKDSLAAQAGRVRASLDAAIRGRNSSALVAIDGQLASLQPAADKLVQGLDAAQARSVLAAQVRGRLQPLAAAFFGGDFARAAQWADEQSLQAVPQARAQALLLRAAARFEIYVLGGERDLADFDRIGADIRAARLLDARVVPSERAFSPRFRALFASTR